MGIDEDRKLAIERLKVRAELRSIGDDEDSQVIEAEAQSRRVKSVPATARGLVAVLDKLPPWGRVIVLVVGIAAGLASALLGGGKLAGWF